MDSIIVSIFLTLMIVVNGERGRSLAATNSPELNELLKKDLATIVASLEESIGKIGELKTLTSDQMIVQAIDICCRAQQESITSVKRAVDRVGHFNPTKKDGYFEDLKIWVGGVFSDQTECLEGFEDYPTDPVKEKVVVILEKPKNLTMSAFEVIGKMNEAENGDGN